MTNKIDYKIKIRGMKIAMEKQKNLNIYLSMMVFAGMGHE